MEVKGTEIVIKPSLDLLKALLLMLYNIHILYHDGQNEKIEFSSYRYELKINYRVVLIQIATKKTSST